MNRHKVQRILISVGLLTAATLACNLPGLGSSSKPTVTITAPADGDEVPVNQETRIAVTATDSAGVTRVELWVSGVMVGSEASSSPQGQPTFSATLKWKPTSIGRRSIQVRAFNRDGQASEPARISLNVVAAAAETNPTLPPVPANCTDDATFVADITVPDGTSFEAGAAIDKGWRFRNSGTCPWVSGYELAFVSGEAMGGPAAQPVPETAPGQTADVHVAMVAPSTPGTHIGTWRMRGPSGSFGQAVKVTITVPGQAPPPPPPTNPPPTSAPPAPAPPTSAPAPTSPPAPCTTPTIEFSIDKPIIMQGESAILTWNVQCVKEVYVNNVGVPGQSKQKVTPNTSMVYTLKVVKTDNSTEEHTMAVALTPAGKPQTGLSGPNAITGFRFNRPGLGIVEFVVDYMNALTVTDPDSKMWAYDVTSDTPPGVPGIPVARVTPLVPGRGTVTIRISKAIPSSTNSEINICMTINIEPRPICQLFVYGAVPTYP